MNHLKAHALVTNESQSALRRYQDVVVGSHSLGFTLKYEIVTALFGRFPGAAGIWLRQRSYRMLVCRMGKDIVIGAGTILHHPRKVSFGRGVAISYDCMFEARGGDETEITVGDSVIIGRNTSIICKDGSIRIGKNVGIGADSMISAVAGNIIEIGDDVLIAPNTYIGGVSYNFERTDIPISHQGKAPQGGIRIGENCWLGARVLVLDGVNIGHDSILAAGAVVTQDIPPFSIAMGVPAKVTKSRKE